MRNAVISFPLFGIELNPPATYHVLGMTLYFYGAIIAIGFLLAVMYCSKRCEDLGTTSDDLLDILLFTVPAGVIGARLYYVVFNFQEFTGDIAGIFRITDGGLAIYGGVIGAIATLFIVCRVKKIKPGPMLDIAGFGFLIGQAAGRWGNFINREVYGYETDFFLRMGLTLPGRATIFVHPLFLYESLWNAAGFVMLHIWSKKVPRKFEGQYFLAYVAWYGFGRMLLEGMRPDTYSLYFFSTGIRVSQMLAAVSAVISVLLIFYFNRKRRI